MQENQLLTWVKMRGLPQTDPALDVVFSDLPDGLRNIAEWASASGMSPLDLINSLIDMRTKGYIEAEFFTEENAQTDVPAK